MADGGAADLTMVPENVRAVVRSSRQIAEDIATALATANREIEALAAGGWTGDAATSFAAGWTEQALWRR